MKKAAVKIIVVVAMAAVVFVNSVVPVFAKTTYSVDIYKSEQPFSNLTGPLDLPVFFGTDYPYFTIVLDGDIKPNYSYSFVIKYTVVNGSSSNFKFENAMISDFGVLTKTVANIKSATIIPDNQISYILSQTNNTTKMLFVTISTKDLAINDDMGLSFTLYHDEISRFDSVTVYGIEDNQNQIYDSINSNLENISTEINNIYNQNINNQNTLQDILISTQQIQQIQNVINNNIISTNQKLDIVNSNLQLLYTVGTGNTIPNNINKLDQSQQQLHSAEDVITRKSESLVSQATAGINTAKSSTTQFINTITPAVASATNTVTQITNTLPSDIKPMLYSMPLLSFAVWLIGLKK